MKKNLSAASKTFSVKALSALLFGTAGVFFAPTMLGLAPQAHAAVPAVKLPDFSDLVDAVGPAVVNIRTTERLKMGGPGAGMGGQDEQEMQEFLRRFFGGAMPTPRQQAPRGGRRAGRETA